MAHRPKQFGLGSIAYLIVLVLVGFYFTMASVKGDFSLFNRARIEAEADDLRLERDRLRAEIAVLANKTRRLSDDYLDLDLLDEQARSVLGLVRPDEVVLR